MASVAAGIGLAVLVLAGLAMLIAMTIGG